MHPRGLLRDFGALPSDRLSNEAPTAVKLGRRVYRVAKPLAEHFEEHLRGVETVVFPAVRELVPRDVQGIVIEELRARRRLAHRSLDVGL